MKTKNPLLLLLFLFILGSCGYPQYLPRHYETGTNVHGSQLTILDLKGVKLSGELIAMNDTGLFILNKASSKSNPKLISVPYQKVRSFRLRYIKPPNYAWTIPIFTLASISHGFFMIITMPVNLITTIAVSAGAENSYLFTHHNISYVEMRKFARFPQGFPEGMDLTTFK